MVTQEYLKERLHYDPETGIFLWREGATRCRIFAGKEAGHLSDQGYRMIGIDGKPYRAHRLAWLYVHGTCPKFLDHKDTNRANNAISNLRESTKSENNWNGRTPSDNKSGVKGVTQYGRQGKWRASVSKHGRQKSLAGFETFEEAVEACKLLRKQLHGEHANNG